MNKSTIPMETEQKSYVHSFCWLLVGCSYIIRYFVLCYTFVRIFLFIIFLLSFRMFIVVMTIAYKIAPVKGTTKNGICEILYIQLSQYVQCTHTGNDTIFQLIIYASVFFWCRLLSLSFVHLFVVCVVFFFSEFILFVIS